MADSWMVTNEWAYTLLIDHKGDNTAFTRINNGSFAIDKNVQ